MSRPLVLRMVPDHVKTHLYYRYYSKKHSEWIRLFTRASLSKAPGVDMFGLVPGDVISGNIAFTGFYELALSRTICKLAQNDGLFVDVGANMGYFSLLWAARSSSGKVIAFEASERNVGIIKNNIERNGFHDRVTVIPKAAGDRDGIASFDAGPPDQTGWGGISRQSSSSTVDVPIVRIDQELADQNINVLKIDVEGADSLVLLGCERLLRKKKIRTIIFEQNLYRMKKLGIRASDAMNFLRDLDYDCVPFDKNQLEWIAYPR